MRKTEDRENKESTSGRPGGKQMRKTKIIATIGPASRSPETLDRLVAAGMDVARLNFSHGTLEEHAEVIASVRAASERQNRPVAVLQDLGGNKFRLGNMAEAIQLNFGDRISIVNEPSADTPDRLPFPEPTILANLRPGPLGLSLRRHGVPGSAGRVRRPGDQDAGAQRRQPVLIQGRQPARRRHPTCP